MRKRIPTIWRKLAGHPRFRKLNELLFDCAVRGLGVLNYEDSEVSGEFHFLGKTFRKLLKAKAPVCVDVGANRGKYSSLILELFPNATLLCVEPHPGNFEQLCAKLGSKAKLVQCAAGAELGKLTLYDRADANGGGSTHASLHREVVTEIHRQGATEVEVKVVTLDDLLKGEGIEEVDLLKIDTEGHELEVLKGAKELLSQQRVRVIQIEFNQMNVVTRVFFNDFLKLLPGYRVYRLLPTGMIKLSSSSIRSELFAFQNLVFIRDDKKGR